MYYIHLCLHTHIPSMQNFPSANVCQANSLTTSDSMLVRHTGRSAYGAYYGASAIICPISWAGFFTDCVAP